MEAPGGVEPPTNSLGNCCSIHLSYGASVDCQRVQFTMAELKEGLPMFEVELVKGVGKLTLESMATIDLWWAKIFGKPLSGRVGRIEIQTLFHGNTKDQEQI